MEKHSLLEPQTKSVKTYHFGSGWDFNKAYSKQQHFLEKVFENDNEAYILTGEHSSVYTLGNSLKKKSEEKHPPNFLQTDRGGKVMYHGPGQLTIYPIFKLNTSFSGPKEYLKFLFDECMNYFLKEHSVKLHCSKNGLWTEDDKKVGFVGLRVKNGITYHGLSLNYNTDLNAFLKHSPCDIEGVQAGNLFKKNEEFDLVNEAKSLSMVISKGL